MDRATYLVRAREFQPRGTDYKDTKLNESKVLWIRENRQGLTAKKQAEIMGVHHRTIDAVRTYKTWAHVGVRK